MLLVMMVAGAALITCGFLLLLPMWLIYVGMFMLMMPFVLAGPQARDRYRECMRRTARMECEVYGHVVSLSVLHWLKDHDVQICKAHPGLLHGRSGQIMGGIVFCECPPNVQKVREYYRPAPPKVPASVSRRKVAKCTDDCSIEELHAADREEPVARYCAKHGVQS